MSIVQPNSLFKKEYFYSSVMSIISAERNFHWISAKLHYTWTPATDMLYATTNRQAHNNSTTCCTTNLPHRNARAQHGMWQIFVRSW